MRWMLYGREADGSGERSVGLLTQQVVRRARCGPGLDATPRQDRARNLAGLGRQLLREAAKTAKRENLGRMAWTVGPAGCWHVHATAIVQPGLSVRRRPSIPV